MTGRGAVRLEVAEDAHVLGHANGRDQRALARSSVSMEEVGWASLSLLLYE